MHNIQGFLLKSILTANRAVLSYEPAYSDHFQAARRLSRFCFELHYGCTGDVTGPKYVPQDRSIMHLETTPIKPQAQPEVGQLNQFQNYWQTNQYTFD